MTTPIEEAFVRVTADTDPASRAIREFARDARREFRRVGSQANDAASNLQRLNTAAQGLRDVRLDLDVPGAARIEAAARSLERLDPAALSAARALEQVREQVVALTAALTALRPAISRVTAALRRIDASAAPRLRELGESISNLGASTQRSASGVDEVTQSVRALASEARNTTATTRSASSENDRNSRSFLDLSRSVRDAAGSFLFTRFRLNLTSISVANLANVAGAAVPVLSGLGQAVGELAPLSGVAITAFTALRLSMAAIQLGTAGVGDAIEALFSSTKGSVEKFERALATLSPTAREFVLAVKSLKPAFVGFQQGVQTTLFTGFTQELSRLAATVFPVLKTEVTQTAGVFNRMALGSASAARSLATSGVLGKALSGANQGLKNLASVPPLVVRSLGQVAAAGAPAFNMLTKAFAGFVKGVSDRLATGFSMGTLQVQISKAAQLFLQLAKVAGNAFGLISNILGASAQSGGGFIATLNVLLSTLRKATATRGFQAAMQAVAQTMSTLATTAGPLLAQAFGAIGQVLVALAPPLQTAIRALGAGLSPLLTGLSPVLAAAAGAFGALIAAIAPLLTTIGTLAGALLPVLVPPLNTLRQIFTLLAPSVAQLGASLTGLLQPIFAALPGLIAPITTLLTTLATAVLPILTQLLTQLAPSFTQLGASLGQVLVAATPLIAVLAQMTAGVLVAIAPIIAQLVPLIAQLAAVLAGNLAAVLNGIVVPTLRLVAAVFRGDFAGAVRAAGQIVTGTFRAIATGIGGAIGIAIGVIRTFAGVLTYSFRGAVAIAKSLFSGMVGTIRGALSSLVGVATSTVARIRGAFTSGGWAGVGRLVVNGLVAGIRGGFGVVAAAARSLAQTAINAVTGIGGFDSHSPSRRFMRVGRDAGRGLILGLTRVQFRKAAARIARDTGRGFISGLTGTQARIKATADKISRTITNAFLGKRTRFDNRLVGWVDRGNRRLQHLARQRDAIVKRIQDANKFAADISAQARDAFSLGNLTQFNISKASILGGLEGGAARIRRFTRELRNLQKRGLRKDLIAQLLNLGPQQGEAIARTLTQQSKTTLRRINAQQAALAKASRSLGRFGADTLFDAGRKAGRGFLTGLQAQRKSIEKLMLSIAKSMQKAIRRALRIKSPSGVFRDLGDDTGAGLELGLLDRIPDLQAAVRSAAEAMRGAGSMSLPGVAAAAVPAGSVGSLRSAQAAPVGNTVVNLTIVNRGVLGGRAEVMNWLTESLDTLQRQRRVKVA